MMAPGHVMAAIATYQLATSIGASPEPYLFIFAVIGGLLPDIDEPRSFLNSLLHIISRPIGKMFKHRGFTHSAIALLLLFWGLALLMDGTPAWLIALWVGFASHIIADFHTIKGVPLLWPLKRLDFRNPVFHFRTGGRVEWCVVMVLVVSTAYMWVYA